MEAITKIPGLQHISEDIFNLLDKKYLIECRLVNSSWKTVLEGPGFWLRKFHFNLENLPFAVRNKWRCLAEELRNDELLKEFVLLMIKIYKGKENNLLNIAVRLKGGYTDPIIPNELKISRYSLHDTNKYHELIKFIIEHDNSNNKFDLNVSQTEGISIFVGNATTIHLATLFGFTEVLKRLNNKRPTPLDGWTAISIPAYPKEYIEKWNLEPRSGCLCCFELAAMGGNLDTMKYLVSITDISIASNHESIQKCSPWCSPIYQAVSMGHLDIVKYLVATMPTPVLFLRYKYKNTIGNSNKERIIFTARQAGHFEVAKFLEDTFSDL